MASRFMPAAAIRRLSFSLSNSSAAFQRQVSSDIINCSTWFKGPKQSLNACRVKSGSKRILHLRLMKRSKKIILSSCHRGICSDAKHISPPTLTCRLLFLKSSLEILWPRYGCVCVAQAQAFVPGRMDWRSNVCMRGSILPGGGGLWSLLSCVGVFFTRIYRRGLAHVPTTATGEEKKNGKKEPEKCKRKKKARNLWF